MKTGERITKLWPGTGAPSWYQRWAAIGPETALELDYVRQAAQFGSSQSKLTLTLLIDPKHIQEVKLSKDEWISLGTWVDLNARYWGTYVDKDEHFASKRSNKKGALVPPRRVRVVFPDPWQRPPAGEWIWHDDATVALKPQL